MKSPQIIIYNILRTQRSNRICDTLQLLRAPPHWAIGQLFQSPEDDKRGGRR